MGHYRQSFIIVEGTDAAIVSERVTLYLNDGYSLHGEMRMTATVPNDHAAYVIYAQAVVKHGEGGYD